MAAGEPGGGDQDRPPQSAAAHRADPRGGTSGRAHRRLESRACGDPRSRPARRIRRRRGRVVLMGIRDRRGRFRVRAHRLRERRRAARRARRRGHLRLPHTPGDPHPISYLRVLLGIETCRYFYGDGPWDALAASWTATLSDDRRHARNAARAGGVRATAAAHRAADARHAAAGFRGRPHARSFNRRRVRPAELQAMETRLGPSLYTSMHWVWESAFVSSPSPAGASRSARGGGGDVEAQEDRCFVFWEARCRRPDISLREGECSWQRKKKRQRPC